jgi:hypothetical protein
VSIIAAVGCNIIALYAAQDLLQPGMSHVTIVADLEPHLPRLVLAKMQRLIEVVSAVDVSEGLRGPRPATRQLALHLPMGIATDNSAESDSTPC